MRSKCNTQSAFSLIELLVVISILGTLTAIGVVGVTNELRVARVVGAANELATWLVAVRRAAERGIPCRITIQNANPVGTANVATGLAVNPVDQSANTTIPNNCLSASPLRFESNQGQPGSFAIDSNSNQFFFTPRGTLFQTGAGVNPIQINIQNVQGGAKVGPIRRVCIRPPLGWIQVAATC